MADATTLKEFLVELGFKVDGNSERKFKDSVNNASKVVGTLAVAMAAAATALAATVAKVAQGFDDIYFAARRTQTSVQGIQSLSYAVSQLGGSYQGARQSIESFAQRLRTNPGYESMVRGLGVATRDANGQLRQSSDILLDIGKQLGKRPYYVANQYAGALGIDETTLQALLSGEIGGRVNEYNSRIQRLGVDLNEAAKAGNALMDAWRGWDATLDAVKAKLEQTFGRQFADAIRQFDEFVQKHAPDIETAFHKAGDAAEFFGGEIRDAFGRIDGAIEKLDKMIAKLTGTGGLQEALDGIGKWIDDTWVVRILKAFGLLEQGWYHLLTSIASAAVPGGFLLGGAPNPGRWVAEQMFGPGGGQQAPGGAEPPGIMGRIWGGIKGGAQKALSYVTGGAQASGAPGTANRSSSVNSDIPPEGRALLDTIASSESPGYNVLYGGGKFDSYADHPRQNIPISSGPNAGRTSSAAGRYQFLQGTWDQQARKLGLTDFSPASQDIAAWDLAQTVYRNRTGRDLVADLQSKDQALISNAGRVLNGTWTSLPGGIEPGQTAGVMASRFNANLSKYTQAPYAPGGSPQFGGGAPKSPMSSFTLDPQTAATLGNLNALRASGDAQMAPLVPAPSVTNNATSFAPSTTITVNGANDPQATADAVSSSQRGVNAGLMRSFHGAVR